MSDGKCARCGEPDDGDLRTLWMACFYAMHELPIPFEQCAVKGIYQEKVGEKDLGVGFGIKTTEYAPHPDQKEPTLYQFYTLRVCKDCRADWMAAIQGWFKAPKPAREGSGTGVWIRDHGTNREATPEEVEEMLRKRGG